MLQSVAEVVFELACVATGHMLLWALSLGRRKPFQGGDALAAVTGLLFWVGIVAGLALLLTS